MYGTGTAATGGFMMVLWILGLIVLIAWILLPFAMFGIKPLLRELIAEAKETNRLLRAPEKAPAKHQAFSVG